MPSAVVLDPEPLLAPISEASPSGQKLALMDRNKLKEQREDFDPERDLSPEDRRNPQMAEQQRKIPQWDKIIQFCTQFLGKSGKDLRAVFALIEALSKRHGFAGLRDGLRLLRRLCEECWGRMHPEILDPNGTEELEARMGLFSFLDEELKQPFFPNVIRAIPLFQQADKPDVSVLNCQPAGNPIRPALVSQDEFRFIVMNANPPAVELIRLADDDLKEAIEETRLLIAVLDAKAGTSAPGLASLRKALAECQTMTNEVMRVRAPSQAVEPSGSDGEPSPDDAGGTPGNRSNARSRNDVYSRLMELTLTLEQLEPHSPVPFLIRRAIEMRDIRFPELVDQLTSSKAVLEFMRNPLVTETPPS